MTQDESIRFVEQLVAPPDPRTRYALADILTSVQQAAAARSGAADEALLALMRSPRPILLAPGSPLTHSMPPDELIRQIVAQLLLGRDPRKYRPYVEQLRDSASTARFRRRIDAFLAQTREVAP